MKKIINKNNIIRCIPYFIIFIIATFLFCQTHISLLLDSEFYYKNATVILGKIPLSEYFKIRGFGYPLYISLFIKVFGNNYFSLWSSAYIIYILINILGFYIINLFLKNVSKTNKIIVYLIYLVLFVFNILILGYSTLIITENISILLMEIGFILLYKWINLDLTNNKLKAILYSIIFTILMVYAYQVKQTIAAYFLIIMFLFIIFSFVKNKNFKNFFIRCLTMLFCLMITYIQIGVWNNFLNKISPITESNKNSDSVAIFSNTLLSGSGISKLESKYFCSADKIKSNKYLSEKQKKELLGYVKNNCSDIYYIALKDGNEIIYENYYVTNDIGILSTFNILLNTFFKHPSEILNNYYDKYLWLINVYDYEYEGYGYKMIKKISNKTKENESNGLFSIKYNSVLWRNVANYDDISIIGIDDFELEKNSSKFIINYYNDCKHIYIDLFKYIFIIIPFVLLLSIILYIKNKNDNYDNQLLAIITLLGSSFGFGIFLTVTAQTIDRYLYVAYPLAIISLIICFISTKNYKKDDK